MVPLSTMITVKDITGPAVVNHYNLYPSAEVSGSTAPGTSSGQAIGLMEQVARRELPAAMGFEWTELTYQQIEAGKDLLTKLDLPAGSPLRLPGAGGAVRELVAAPGDHPHRADVPAGGHRWASGWLDWTTTFSRRSAWWCWSVWPAKNAILIVEFAKQREDEGMNRADAAVDACRTRLRPILMTSFAFILGVVPLVLAKGAGAEMRVGLGVAVFSGMLGVTLFGLFFTPVFYVVIRWFTGRTVVAPAPPVGPPDRKAIPAVAAIGAGPSRARDDAETDTQVRPFHRE